MVSRRAHWGVLETVVQKVKCTSTAVHMERFMPGSGPMPFVQLQEVM